jgi:hypothetical protein
MPDLQPAKLSLQSLALFILVLQVLLLLLLLSQW